MEPQLTLTVHRDGHAAVLTVGGEVDLATAPQLRAKLVDLDGDGIGTVVVDLTPVAFMDSTGLGVLLAAHRRAQAGGRTIRLVCPEGPVLRVVRLSGLVQILPVHSALAEAVHRSLAEAVGAQDAG